MAASSNEIITTDDIAGLRANINYIDQLVESQQDTLVTPGGIERLTLVGQLNRIGYTAPVPYVANLVFDADDGARTVEFNNNVYAPFLSALPFTTSGTFVGDDDARFRLINPDEADEITYDNTGTPLTATNTQDAITELANMPSSAPIPMWANSEQISTGLALASTDTSMVNFSNQVAGTGVAFINQTGDLTTLFWNGASWATVGTALSLGALTIPRLTALQENRIILYDATSNTLRAYDFTQGTLSWAQVGSASAPVPQAAAADNITYASVTSLNSTDIVVCVDGEDTDTSINTSSITVFRFDGTSFTQIGNSLFIIESANAAASGVSALSATTIGWINNGRIRTYSFNGTDFTLSGTELDFLLGTATTGAALDTKALNNADIICDYEGAGAASDDRAVILRWNGSTWSVASAFMVLAFTNSSLCMFNGIDYAVFTNGEVTSRRLSYSIGPLPPLVDLID